MKQNTSSKWYNECGCSEQSDSAISDAEVKRFELKANSSIELENEKSKSKYADSEESWLRTVALKGTAHDRISAIQILVQRSPLDSLSHLNYLLSVMQKKNPREASSVIEVLKTLFIDELLPADRKLISLNRRPIDRLNAGDHDSTKVKMNRKMILWKFESDLKRIYEKFVSNLGNLADGNIEKIRSAACHVALDLLAERPEQEQNLLTLLVNKLGHPNNKFVCTVSRYLKHLCHRQPNIRSVVIQEVERLIYRKNVSCRAQLHAVAFLSQIRIFATDSDCASSLIRIYFGLFRELVAKDRMEDRILSVLFSAANRIFPFIKGEAAKFNEEIDTLYKLVHSSNFATTLQTLRLLYQLQSSCDIVPDRFYNALYRKLLHIGNHCSQEEPLFSLLYTVLTTDSLTCRVAAFVKRILQLSLCRSAAFAAAALIFLSRLQDAHPDLIKVSAPGNKTIASELLKVENNSNCTDDNDEEHYSDASSGDNCEKLQQNAPCNTEKRTKNTSWVHRNNIVVRNVVGMYDPYVRNPSYAGADRYAATELLLLSRHYHPSVALFASTLLEGRKIEYDGDALVDFSAMRFLDRFVYKNPKKGNLSKQTQRSRRKVYNPSGAKKLDVRSDEYTKKNIEEVPVDERFIHRFTASRVKTIIEKDGSEPFDDMDSVASDEFEMLLERFEPGEKNEEFDVDFGEEFGSKRARKGRSRSYSNEDSLDEESGSCLGEESDDLCENDGNEQSDGEEFDGISDEKFRKRKSATSNRYYGSESDNDISDEMAIEKDALMSADKFAEIMEESYGKEVSKEKRKVRKPNRFKKRRSMNLIQTSVR